MVIAIAVSQSSWVLLGSLPPPTMCFLKVPSDGSQKTHPIKIKISVVEVFLPARPWVLKQNKTKQTKQAPFTETYTQRSLRPCSTPSGAAS